MKTLLALTALLAAALLGLPLLALLLSAGAGASACTTASSPPTSSPTAGSWVATAYGPPWGGIQGNGITATGLNLTGGPAAYEVAVDPSVIPLGSYVHIQPNPFNTASAFYAGDTGAAITGDHIDIYDWQGRQSQNAWGTRNVSVTPTAAPSGQNLLDGLTPTPLTETSAEPQACAQPTGQHARILPSGEAVAPPEAPAAVKLAIAAGNLIHTLPYPEPDTHYGSLTKLWPAYDCSGATSFLLYAAHLLSPTPLDSSELETYGRPGSGHWITVYANPAHTWIVIAGIALDTANYGGPAIPAGTGPRWRAEPVANLHDDNRYTVRHPPGL